MRTPQALRSVDHRDAVVTEYEHDDGSHIAVDFGAAHGDLALDVVDDTAIVIAGGERFEFALPSEANGVTTNNGVLTITE